ncbi:MAG: response regulator transcription factor, partial [Planctomycetes bacterium]|nr:response regulator transcription factor [Planctomycetota bacterium]
DVDPWRDAVSEQLQDVHSRLPQTPVVALTNFDHPQQISRIQAAGADAVVGKLAPQAVLLEALDVVVSSVP